jgi:hypothetical protein
MMMKKEEKENDKLLSNFILSLLDEDELAIKVINTRLLNRLNEGLLDLGDMVLVYKFFSDELT